MFSIQKELRMNLFQMYKNDAVLCRSLSLLRCFGVDTRSLSFGASVLFQSLSLSLSLVSALVLALALALHVVRRVPSCHHVFLALAVLSLLRLCSALALLLSTLFVVCSAAVAELTQRVLHFWRSF